MQAPAHVCAMNTMILIMILTPNPCCPDTCCQTLRQYHLGVEADEGSVLVVVGEGEVDETLVDVVEQDDDEAAWLTAWEAAWDGIEDEGVTVTVGTPTLLMPPKPPPPLLSVTEWLVEDIPDETPEVECLENLVLDAFEKALWQDWSEVMDPR